MVCEAFTFLAVYWFIITATNFAVKMFCAGATLNNGIGLIFTINFHYLVSLT